MPNVCSPAQHSLNEVDLLLQELQLRMTAAVRQSPLYAASLQSRHALYTILADFFESQQAEARRAAAVALDAMDVHRVWLYCFTSLVCHANSQRQSPSREEQQQRELTGGMTDRHNESDPDSHDTSSRALHRFLMNSPSLPIEALQHAAPEIPAMQTQSRAAANPSPPSTSATAATAPPVSLFSLVRRVLPSLLELSYTVDGRLRRRPAAADASPTASLSLLVLAAVTASLVPSLDRVQAVRWTAQLADDVRESYRRTEAAQQQKPVVSDAILCEEMALLLAGVWWVWGELDRDHATPLRALAEQLVASTFGKGCASSNNDDHLCAPPSLAATGHAPPVTLFTSWLQEALRARGGAVHQQLYKSGARPSQTEDSDGGTSAKSNLPQSNAMETEFLGAQKKEGTASGEAKNESDVGDRDFWAQLAS